jgi:hypothetical protein
MFTALFNQAKKTMLVMMISGDGGGGSTDDNDDDSDIVLMKINLESGKFREDAVICSSRHQQNSRLIDFAGNSLRQHLFICSLFNVRIRNSV